MPKAYELHGLWRKNQRLYYLWNTMRQRCSNAKLHEYPYYGGRGIRVCRRWQDSFQAFYDDMGPRPPGFTIDRIDGDGPYSPQNCHWVSRAEQMRNTRANRKLTLGGETLCLTDWARRHGLNPKTVEKRIRNGWELTRALTEPADQRYRTQGNTGHRAKKD